MKIATITFSRAQNFGSVLQTYALQEFVKKLYSEIGEECEYSVIDFYTEFQKQFYSIYKPISDPKNIFKNAVAFRYRNQLKTKQKKFDEFLSTYVNMTETVRNSNEISSLSSCFDYYISGSDQIWNVRAADFEDEYYLNFVKNGKKISYSASMGPLDIDWEKYGKEKYADFINSYDAVSVRETGTADKVRFLTGKNADVNVDPTFLLNKEEWQRIESDANYCDGKYILLYCLEPSKEQLSIANAISNKFGLPILITRYNNKNDIINRFVKKYDCGPLDFLSYIDNAALVLSSSFHGTVFSMIYNKPFYVFNGMKDSRISSILKIAGIEDRSIDSADDISRVNLNTVDFSKVNEIINSEQNRSKEYLKKALNIYEE